MPVDPLAPLLQFYHAAGIAAPDAVMLDGAQIPQPARQLLVHDVDMTSTLQSFYGRTIELDILSREHSGEVLKREVVLRLGGTRKPVEFGAIDIHLTHMPALAAEAVVAGVMPLGGILSKYSVGYTSHPSAFFQVRSDEVMAKCFHITSPSDLYGRCNILTYAGGDLLARVVEVLPPLEQIRAGQK